MILAHVFHWRHHGCTSFCKVKSARNTFKQWNPPASAGSHWGIPAYLAHANTSKNPHGLSHHGLKAMVRQGTVAAGGAAAATLVVRAHLFSRDVTVLGCSHSCHPLGQAHSHCDYKSVLPMNFGIIPSRKTVGLLAKRRSEHHSFTWPELDEYLRDPLSDCVNELREVQEISWVKHCLRWTEHSWKYQICLSPSYPLGLLIMATVGNRTLGLMKSLSEPYSCYVVMQKW